MPNMPNENFLITTQYQVLDEKKIYNFTHSLVLERRGISHAISSLIFFHTGDASRFSSYDFRVTSKTHFSAFVFGVGDSRWRGDEGQRRGRRQAERLVLRMRVGSGKQSRGYLHRHQIESW